MMMHIEPKTIARPISDFQFDEVELIIIELLRRFCVGFANPESQSWFRAFQRAEIAFGAVNGPAIAFAISEYVMALRNERQSAFHFVDPDCADCAKRIYPTEANMLLLVRSTYLGDRSNARTHMQSLVEDGEGQQLIGCAHALAEQLRTLTAQMDAGEPRLSPNLH